MSKLQLIYVYDPLCGWCYGFSPVIKEFYKKFRTKLSVEVVSGGMVLGERAGPVGKMAAYIQQAYKVVEDRTSVKFGKKFLHALKDGQMIFSSLPPSRALTAFKHIRPQDAILMAHEIQKSIYYRGEAPTDEQVYLKLAKKFELPVNKFQELLWSDQIAKATEEDFKRSAALGVSGFPTVFIGNEKELMPIARGYLPYEDLLMNAINAGEYFGQPLVN
ncbi:MAG: DsbA family protein [Fulvivirga sp.]|nr:DsbA family protein [Fulvivirga sp.]